jgi:hypothetical protein
MSEHAPASGASKSNTVVREERRRQPANIAASGASKQTLRNAASSS